MTIRIEPYKYNLNENNTGEILTYWGVFIDDLEISTTSTKEKALETKEWMESYLDTHH